MAQLLYRASTTPNTPTSTSAKGAPLTNLEVDGNFKSLNDDLALKAYIASPTFTGDVAINSVTALKVPVGTTEQRPGTVSTGLIRYNTSLKTYEGYAEGAWGSIGGGSTGAPGNHVFWINDIAITANYTLPTNQNAGTFGPVTIDAGVVVEVPEGSTWTIV